MPPALLPPDGEGLVLVVGDGADRAAVARALTSRDIETFEASPEQGAALLREPGFEAALVCSGSLRAEAPPAFPVIERGPGEALEAAAARVAERVWTSPRGRARALAGAVESAFADRPLGETLHLALRRLAPALPSDRAWVVGLEDGVATAVASADLAGFRRPVELSRYPEIAEALRARQPVVVADAWSDPRFEAVLGPVRAAGARSMLVVPLAAGGEVLGALFARVRERAGAYDGEAQAFARAAAVALAQRIRAARRETALARQGVEREAAWEGRVRDLEASQRRAAELRRYKDESVSLVAHDVRGPLNILYGHARLLADAELGPEADGSIQAILRQTRKLIDLSYALSEQGRADEARPALAPAEVDLAAACREAVAEHQAAASARGVAAHVEAPERLTVVADAIKIGRVLARLVERAVAGARDGGTVRVCAERQARPEGEQALVRIAHDGPAPTPRELAGIFERFGPARVPGLAQAREWVELHGGEAWAEAGAAGGVCLAVALPAVGTRMPKEVERPRILLVEDEAAIAAITAEALRTRYRVEVAADGAEAVARAHASRPDLILMDVFLPQLDGLDATAALQAAPDTHAIPIILVSAHQGVAEKAKALHLGAVDYLTKPVDVQTLLARVAAALARAAPPDGKAAGRQVPGIDAASGLLGRDAFLHRVAQEASRARRYGRPLALVAFLPTLAAEAGSLGPAAAALSAGLRDGDVAAHLGEGTFAACLPEAVEAAALRGAGRLAGALGQALGRTVRIGAVDGLAGDPDEQLALALERAAD